MRPSPAHISFFINVSLIFYSGNLLAQKIQNGVRADYYNGTNFNYLVVSKIEKKIGFWRELKSPAKGVDKEYFSIYYSGSIKAPTTGVYAFHVVADDGVRVRINHRLIIDAWIDQEATAYSALIFLEKDELYDLEIDYYNSVVHSIFTVKWELPAASDKLFDFRHEPRIIEIPTSALVPHRSKPKQGSLMALAISKKEIPASLSAPVAQTVVKRNLKTSIESKSVPVNEPIILKTVVFDQQSSILKSSALEELDLLVNYLNRNAHTKIQISGYTDYLGDSLDNRILSENRALTIARYLLTRGIRQERISSAGLGSRFPLIISNNLEERKVNRRVEFKIVDSH